MATGLSSYLANAWLDSAGNASSFSVSTVYIKLHIGDPTSTGTANPATETIRNTASFGAASAGSLTSDADVTWANIAGSQTATYFSAWDAASAGNFLFSGSVTGNPYNAGDTFTIASGALTVSLTLAS
tara:strand:+ start:307 stop:690 length:384 start_codon:yes stop_codon:yes gene_type:complete